MRYIEAATVVVMVLCITMAMCGCTAMALVAVFVVAAITRAAIEVKNLMGSE